jgi:hypothetical protein
MREDAVIIRLSQKLSAKIKVGALATLPLDENPFADWSAHLFVVDRTQYILLSNSKSLYSTVLHGKGITDDSAFIERALSSLREVMVAEGQETTFQRCIAPASAEVRFAKALDRSVTGSMNDLIKHASFWLADDHVAPQEAGVRLNDILLSALARSDSFPYGKPREAFQAMLDSTQRSESSPQA